MPVLIYVIQFLLTHVFFSVVIALMLNRFNGEGRYTVTEIFIYSAGLGSAVTSLILYYLFLVFPGLPTNGYFVMVMVCFLVPAFLMAKDFSLVGNGFNALKAKMKESKSSAWMIILFILGGLFFFALAQILVMVRPLTEHDVLEYGTQAKVFFRERCIKYQSDHYDSLTGFYFVGLHGFSFIMLSVWELTGNALAHVSKDYFFKSITTYYWLLIVLVQFFWLSKKDIVLAQVTSILIFTSSGYLMTMLVYHLDTYRIFLLMMSMICMLKAIQFNDPLSILLFGVFAGLSAFAHSIGALLGVAELGLYFLFVKGSLVVRLKGGSVATLLFLLCGGVHYILDVFWGSGWIFKDIKFY